MANSAVIHVGIKGTVMAIEAASGRQLWVTKLTGGDFVNVVRDGAIVYAGTQGEIFCLDANTGAIRWHNPLKGYGYGLVSIATENVSPGGLLNLVSEVKRREAAAAAASSSASTSSS